MLYSFIILYKKQGYKSCLNWVVLYCSRRCGNGKGWSHW